MVDRALRSRSRRCGGFANVAAWACNVSAIVIIFVVIFLDTAGTQPMRMPMLQYSLDGYVDTVESVLSDYLRDLGRTISNMTHEVPRTVSINFLSSCVEMSGTPSCTRHDVFDNHPVYEAIFSDIQNETERLLIADETHNVAVQRLYHITFEPINSRDEPNASANASLVRKQDVIVPDATDASREMEESRAREGTRAMDIIGSDTILRWSRSQDINSGVPFILLCLGLSITFLAIIIETAAFVVFHMKPYAYRTPINVALIILILIAAAVLTSSAAFITAQINSLAVTYTPYNDYDTEQFEIDDLARDYDFLQGLENATVSATPGSLFRILTWVPVGLSWAALLFTALATYGGRDVTRQGRRALARNISSPRGLFQSSSQRTSVYGWQRESEPKPDGGNSEPPSGVVSVEKSIGTREPRGEQEEGEGSRQASGEEGGQDGHRPQRDSTREPGQEGNDPMRRLRHSDVSSLSSSASSIHEGPGGERRLSAL